MNCKQGDMAIIVGGNPANHGLIVHVVAPWNGPARMGAFLFGGEEAAWLCRTTGRPIVTRKFGKEIAFYERPIADSVLRPIRDPGEDAADETLSWLPVPTERAATRKPVHGGYPTPQEPA